jgi:hypothetical protein
MIDLLFCSARVYRRLRLEREEGREKPELARPEVPEEDGRLMREGDEDEDERGETGDPLIPDRGEEGAGTL